MVGAPISPPHSQRHDFVSRSYIGVFENRAGEPCEIRLNLYAMTASVALRTHKDTARGRRRTTKKGYLLAKHFEKQFFPRVLLFCTNLFQPFPDLFDCHLLDDGFIEPARQESFLLRVNPPPSVRRRLFGSGPECSVWSTHEISPLNIHHEFSRFYRFPSS